MSQVRDCTLHNLFEVFEDMVECNFEWTKRAQYHVTYSIAGLSATLT